jgi:hypothetical protein
MSTSRPPEFVGEPRSTRPFPPSPQPTAPYPYPTPPAGGPAQSWPPVGPQQPWPQAGPVDAGRWGPPPGRPDGPPLPPPPGRSRSGIVVAAVLGVLAVLAVVAGALVYTSIPVDGTSPAPTAPAPPPEITPSAAAEVTVTITDNLASFQTAESATVYSFGEEVGTLRINSSSPTDELTVTSEPGQVDYQLQIEMVLTDEYGGHHITLNGAGSISAYEGARYYVDIVRDSSGTWVATLSPSGTT